MGGASLVAGTAFSKLLWQPEAGESASLLGPAGVLRVTPGVGAAASATGHGARVGVTSSVSEAILSALKLQALRPTDRLCDLRQVTHLLANLWHSGSMSSVFRERFKGLVLCM